MEHANRAGQGPKSGTMTGAARSLAQVTAGVVGLLLVAAGILGFFYGGSDFGVGGNLTSDEFLGFDVNGWHNVVHIASGGFLLLMLPTAKSATIGLIAFGLIYAVVAVWGFFAGDAIAQAVPVNTADNILHTALAAIALIIGATAAAMQAGAKRAI